MTSDQNPNSLLEFKESKGEFSFRSEIIYIVIYLLLHRPFLSLQKDFVHTSIMIVYVLPQGTSILKV